MGLRDDLKKKALSLSGMAMERIFADESRAQRIARTVGAMQQGKKSLDQAQDELLRTLGFASRSDYKNLGRQLSALKRQVRDLTAKMERL